MKLAVEFDLDADIIEVPQSVIDDREHLRAQFIDWLYDDRIRHAYRKTFTDSNGRKFVGMVYRSDAFVEWLNKMVLVGTGQTARVLKSHAEPMTDLPKILF